MSFGFDVDVDADDAGLGGLVFSEPSPTLEFLFFFFVMLQRQVGRVPG